MTWADDVEEAYRQPSYVEAVKEAAEMDVAVSIRRRRGILHQLDDRFDDSFWYAQATWRASMATDREREAALAPDDPEYRPNPYPHRWHDVVTEMALTPKDAAWKAVRELQRRTWNWGEWPSEADIQSVQPDRWPDGWQGE